MICVYPPDCTDFSANGSGALSPLSCEVTETLNGEYELTLVQQPFSSAHRIKTERKKERTIMKTKEGLNARKEDCENRKVRLAQLSEEEIVQVIAGLAPGRKYRETSANQEDSLPTYYHTKCGGRILRGDIFHNCRCEGCGEEHYFLESFSCKKVCGIKAPTPDD